MRDIHMVRPPWNAGLIVVCPECDGGAKFVIATAEGSEVAVVPRDMHGSEALVPLLRRLEQRRRGSALEAGEPFLRDAR